MCVVVVVSMDDDDDNCSGGAAMKIKLITVVSSRFSPHGSRLDVYERMYCMQYTPTVKQQLV